MNKKMIGTILMATGALLLLSGFAIFNTTDKPKEPMEQSLSEESTYDINKKKGDDFEKFIVQKFDKELFTIKEWAGDKYVNGVFAESTLHPDLLMELKIGSTTNQFSVECKWRKQAFQGKIEFSYKEQFARYKKYAKEKDIPVFIALGLGGTPSAPEKLYIIPLQEINTWELKISDLKAYKITTGKDFYYNTKTKTLELSL